MQDNWNRFILQFRLHRQTDGLPATVIYVCQHRLKMAPVPRIARFCHPHGVQLLTRPVG